MSFISFSKPVEIELFDTTIVVATNVRTSISENIVSKNYIQQNSVGYWETYNLNGIADVGTISYQMVSDINGDASPPVVPISSGCIFDQDPDLTFESFSERSNSAINQRNAQGLTGIPTTNFSGALLDNISGTSPNAVVTVQGSNNPLEKFPSSGKILLNREVLSYTSKTNTTLVGVTRGVDGSIEEVHTNGDYLRTISL